MASILVAGATGQIGGLTLKALFAKDVQNIRVFVRDVNKARAQFGDKVSYAQGDIENEAQISAALAGVERLFLAINDAPGSWKSKVNFIRLAKAAQVKHIVYISAVNPDINARAQSVSRWHAQVEKYLFEEADVPYTILRPGFFFQGILGDAAAIKSGVFARPVTTPIVYTDARDIAYLAALTLTSPIKDHTDIVYWVRPVAYTPAELAAVFTKVFGYTVVSKHVDDATFTASLSGLPNWLIEFILDLHQSSAISLEAQTPQQDFKRITGKDPITLEQFLEENKAVFAK